MTNDPVKPEDIEWEWHSPPSASNTLRAGDGGVFVFVPSSGSDDAAIERRSSTGSSLWSTPAPAGRANAAAMVHRAPTLYVALYIATATGCGVVALNETSGNLLWETPLQGLGALHHSKYSNAVQMRFIGNYLVIFGDEAGGRYIEVLDPDSGQRLSGRSVPKDKP